MGKWKSGEKNVCVKKEGKQEMKEKSNAGNKCQEWSNLTSENVYKKMRERMYWY